MKISWVSSSFFPRGSCNKYYQLHAKISATLGTNVNGKNEGSLCLPDATWILQVVLSASMVCLSTVWFLVFWYCVTWNCNACPPIPPCTFACLQLPPALDQPSCTGTSRHPLHPVCGCDLVVLWTFIWFIVHFGILHFIWWKVVHRLYTFSPSL